MKAVDNPPAKSVKGVKVETPGKLLCFGAGSHSPSYCLPRAFPKKSSVSYAAAAGHLSNVLATHLINSQFTQQPLRTRSPHTRWLVSPDALGVNELASYARTMAPFAFSPSWQSTAPPQSPLIAAYLMGGITTTKVQALAHRVLWAADFPDYLLKVDESERALTDAMAMVGFGQHADYLHVDDVQAAKVNLRPGSDPSMHAELAPEPVKPVSSLFSVRQQYLANEIPGEGPFVPELLHRGAYAESMSRNISRMKWDVCVDAWRLFHLQPGEMQPYARNILEDELGAGHYADKVRITDMKFSNAVNRVFRKSWADLELQGTAAELSNDVERAMARLIIKRLAGGGARASAKPIQVSAVTLVGIAMLTGLPINNLLTFAVQDFARRGETFISEQTFDDIDALISESELGILHFGELARTEFNTLRMTFADWHKNESTQPIAVFARKLRLGSSILWSRQGFYHCTGSRQIPNSDGHYELHYEPRLDVRLQGLPKVWPFEV